MTINKIHGVVLTKAPWARRQIQSILQKIQSNFHDGNPYCWLTYPWSNWGGSRKRFSFVKHSTWDLKILNFVFILRVPFINFFPRLPFSFQTNDHVGQPLDSIHKSVEIHTFAESSSRWSEQPWSVLLIGRISLPSVFQGHFWAHRITRVNFSDSHPLIIPSHLSVGGTCEYDEISLLWLCYLIWQKGDYPGEPDIIMWAL